MAWFTASEGVVRFAAWAGVAILALCLGLLLAIGVLHWHRRWQEARAARVLAIWRPLLLESVYAPLPPAPPLQGHARLTVLWLWTRLCELLDGNGRAGLVAAGRQLALDRDAVQLLLRGKLREQLLAALTLGHLRNPAAWEPLLATLQAWHATLSMAAAAALVRIDAARALPIVLQAGAQRPDWPTGPLLSLLREIGPERVTEPLRAALAAAEGPGAGRLLRLLPAAYPEVLRPVLLERLDHDADPDFIAGALRHLNDPRDVERVRAYCTHPAWVVRLRAVHALGRLGGRLEVATLLDRLDDEEWWVRYRAAESLLDVMAVEPDALERVLSVRRVSDRGRETVAQLRAARMPG